MRITVCIFTLLACLNTIAGETIVWEHSKKSQLPKIYQPSLNVAKKWAAKYYEDQNDIIRFIYSIEERPHGFEVMITVVNKGEFVATDGEMCVSTNKEHSLIKSKQCLAL